MSTIHNKAEKGQIAEAVLMPGDPKRAEYIARTYLEDAVLVNDVRCAYCFTGSYKGKRISVMASGMGSGSMGIYSHELFHDYGVERIIRVGSAGGISPGLKLNDIVIASASCTDSGYITHFGLPGTFAPAADFSLMRKAAEHMEANGISYQAGLVFSGAAFHYPDGFFGKWAAMSVLAVEMESAALYINAAEAGKKALCLCTISDNLLDGGKLSPDERETAFGRMITTALEIA